MLSILGTDFIACWACAEMLLKVEYLGRIEYDFQKSRVTGPWDHKVSVSAKKSKKKFHACVPLKTGVFSKNTKNNGCRRIDRALGPRFCSVWLGYKACRGNTCTCTRVLNKWTNKTAVVVWIRHPTVILCSLLQISRAVISKHLQGVSTLDKQYGCRKIYQASS